MWIKSFKSPDLLIFTEKILYKKLLIINWLTDICLLRKGNLVKNLSFIVLKSFNELSVQYNERKSHKQ